MLPALRTGALIDALEHKAERHGRVAQDLVRDALSRRGDILVGSSASTVRLRQEIELIARSNFPVLVSGETGVGKELVVRTLHQQSRRADQPLIYLNCAALPESVAESELFGHTRGAFTGAVQARPGKFKVADGACLFLDEIGELPAHIQPKLLRALQEGEVQPVGSDRTERVDVRIFAATNRDLEAEVKAGRFRADLLHRLDVCRLRVPPLRENLGDVPALAGHFADRVRKHIGCGPIRYEPSAFCALEAGDWPGRPSACCDRSPVPIEPRARRRVEPERAAHGAPASGVSRESCARDERFTRQSYSRRIMNAPAKGCLAGLASWQLGGGLIGTIVVFVLVYWLLGHC